MRPREMYSETVSVHFPIYLLPNVYGHDVGDLNHYHDGDDPIDAEDKINWKMARNCLRIQLW
jgi:hypothetical protein